MKRLGLRRAPPPPPKQKYMGLPLEYLRAVRSDIVKDWRLTPTPSQQAIKAWAKQVSDLNACIAALEAALIGKGVDPT